MNKKQIIIDRKSGWKYEKGIEFKKYENEGCDMEIMKTENDCETNDVDNVTGLGGELLVIDLFILCVLCICIYVYVHMYLKMWKSIYILINIFIYMYMYIKYTCLYI
jgi:hypothetical protein